MDELDVDVSHPLVTLGHDWGGIISLGWAVRHSNVVDAAVSLNTAVDHPSGEPVPCALRAAMSPAVLPSATVLTDAFLRTTLALAAPQGSAKGLPPEVAAAYRSPMSPDWVEAASEDSWPIFRRWRHTAPGRFLRRSPAV
ncbi:alpha/beta fold hydrolase [Nesterenkonia pannonica]|uniref:alpha/beta fold hydrolase n=1 Tax=Nesterenkonia pannonica TaxID=1548602 RepID=UPI002164595C|nr:alpha/beta fold hydrolase [Nesterenkonia pannonica]